MEFLKVILLSIVELYIKDNLTPTLSEIGEGVGTSAQGNIYE